MPYWADTRSILIVVLFVIILIVTIGVNSSRDSQNELIAIVEEYELELELLKEELEYIKSEYHFYESLADTQEREIVDLHILISSLEERPEVHVLDEYLNVLYQIGFVPSGSDIFHAFDCPDFSETIFYFAHDKAYCYYLGYSPHSCLG